MQAQANAKSTARAKIGEISSYDGQMNVKVMFQPENVESEWMPLGCIGIGNSWGVAVGPNIGDQVLVEFPEGDIESGVVTARVFSVAQPAIPVPAGEIWMVHKAGSSLKFLDDGEVRLSTTGNLTANVTGNASITSTGDATVTAPSISLGAMGQSLLAFVTSAFESLFNDHTHPDPQGGNTLAPNQKMGAEHLTTTVKGG
ncbi:phage baseplate assembly protein V [Burkholderia multivorans]|uniref:phage baseplate assembly protein V n=1 Tax=Burkholderia multivorans TaxID=87883 RepID=UPI0012D98499|nr:phage baseplate assembly protein V [Burkholderia multivorans]MBU9203136.1 phage baseplate assembly protein V [Burkholderia multivorans]MCA8385375.1 phage baseplate assembly protein V [Burkholderia multivorans]